MDIVHDQLVGGRAFRVLTTIDNKNCNSVMLKVGFRPTEQNVVDALERVGKILKLAATINVDQGTEFTSLALEMNGLMLTV